MASSGERRLVFDTRGKRKHVVRVVYAILALLMGGSLFLVTGGINLGSLLGSSGSSTSAGKIFEEQAERVERRLAKAPDDEQQLLVLTRARINAGNAQIEPATSETEAPTITTEARANFDAGTEAWDKYLKQTDKPNPAAAQLVGATFFRLAEAGSLSVSEITTNAEEAAKAQRLAAEQQPSLGSLSTLAIYEFFAGDFAAGDKAMEQAVAKTTSKAGAKEAEEQLGEFRKRAVAFEKSAKKAVKQEQKAGKEALRNPFGLGGGSLGG
jgi:hypothetical protein